MRATADDWNRHVRGETEAYSRMATSLRICACSTRWRSLRSLSLLPLPACFPRFLSHVAHAQVVRLVTVALSSLISPPSLFPTLPSPSLSRALFPSLFTFCACCATYRTGKDAGACDGSEVALRHTQRTLMPLTIRRQAAPPHAHPRPRARPRHHPRTHTRIHRETRACSTTHSTWGAGNAVRGS